MSSSGVAQNNLISYHNLNNRIAKILDTWLKFGTVFLIYRLFTYYFFDRNNPCAVFFEKESVALVLFILLGFAIYYLIVDPYLPQNLKHPILRNITNDTLMFGTVLVTAHILETYMNHGTYLNSEWLKTAVMVLLAFAAYRVLINPFIPLNKMNSQVRPIVSDWAQFGTFLIIFRILQRRSLTDEKWILSLLFVLLGFTGYHLITKKIIK